ncbi:MAG TPA: DUF2271 domain-containing protein [Polyangia bacterium]|jgi:hypothetical protein|nr:DUF2271 domain-containing protein [Polyangia bacterium]
MIFVAAIFLAPVLLLVGCQAAPVDDLIGWDGRGMSLPVDTGSGGGGPSSGTGGGAAGDNGGAGGIFGTVDGSGGTVGVASGGAAGSDVVPTDSGVTPPPAPDGGAVTSTCHLDVTVTTHSTGRGGYDPRNVGAIWIENSAQKFIKSLDVWASRRLDHLTSWNAATSAAGLSRNRVDAITAATLSNYGTRTGSWNCTDTNEKPVAAADYQVCFDLNDTNSASKSNCVTVTIGKSPTTVKVPDALPCFTGRTFTFTP